VTTQHFAAELAREAGALARRRFYGNRTIAVNHKLNGELVTDVDREVENLIISLVREKFPKHGILGEESGLSGNQNECWVIDPIDGTTNFVCRYLSCSVSVAFCRKGRPVVAAIHDIAANETFFAASGEGAYLNNQRLRVTTTTTVGKSLFLASGVINGKGMWPLIESMARRSMGMRRTGSTALDMATVAAGRADAMLCGPVKFWDVAAGALLIREAGGLISDTEDHTSFAFGEPTLPFVAGTPGVFTAYLHEMKKHQ
jgi:myo-inositol-1(or 4)-monophosphatase